MALLSTPQQIGIDAAEDAVRLVAVRGRTVVAATEVPVVSGAIVQADAAWRARTALERQGVHVSGRHIAVAPMAVMNSTVLELPPRSSGAPIESLAAAEMARGLGGEGLEVAVFPLRTRDNGPSEYFVTAARRDGVMELVGNLQRAGVPPIAIDAPVTALMRACDSQNCLAIVCGEGAASLHASYAGTPILSRSVAIPQGAGMPHELVGEIDRCAGYLATYQADTAIEEVVLAGPHAGLEPLRRTIAEEFDIRVRIWAANNTTDGRPLGPAFAAAYGAATWSRQGRKEIAA